MRITYNAPFVLTFTFAAVCVMAFSEITGGRITEHYFTLQPGLNYLDPLFYFRLFSHVAGHASWEHLASNFAYILLIGPILEEKYGSERLFFIAMITALITGLLNAFFFPSFLLGASGIVFMMILLGSFANVQSGTIPMTFILIVLLFLGKEVLNAWYADNNISEFAHIVGGVCGSIFGFSQHGGSKSPEYG